MLTRRNYCAARVLGVREGADAVIVSNGGRVVEQGPSLEVNRNPQDWYTRLLLDAIPNPFEQTIR